MDSFVIKLLLSLLIAFMTVGLVSGNKILFEKNQWDCVKTEFVGIYPNREESCVVYERNENKMKD